MSTSYREIYHDSEGRVKNLEEAAAIVKETYPDMDYNYVVETPTWYVFSMNDDSHTIVDPIGVNKENGECRGVVPPIHIPDYNEAKTVWDRRS